MNNKIAAITAITASMALTMCSSIAIGKEMFTPPSQEEKIMIPSDSPLIDFMSEKTVEVTLIEYQILVEKQKQEQKRLKNKQLNQNLNDLQVAIDNTLRYVDKTWYVFSGSTPEGWDCSGLVMWTYSHLGFNLYHGATAQVLYGDTVSEPKYGDIVGFKYSNHSNYYHVGIYISEDLMLHSGGKKGDKTELRSISDFAGNHSKVSYSRLIETN